MYKDNQEHLGQGIIKSTESNVQRTAMVANLKYVSDAEPGIKRVKAKDEFAYTFNNRKVIDEQTLDRIKKLVIPPAWKNVWICKNENGHIQCTGTDVKGRKQYRYHHLWNKLRSKTKFYRLKEFGESLPHLRQQLEKDIAQRNLTEEKVLATVIRLTELTYIRIGNLSYERLYGSYGLTTMKDNHVKINGDNLSFSFKGKKGIHHNITLRNKRIAKIVKQCKDIPGKELFQYKDEEGNYKSIGSEKINNYLKNNMGSDFTTKDFRTWAGSVNALLAFRNLPYKGKATGIKKNINEMLDFVSKNLGNTRAVCKKYYVHPLILELYENQKLDKIFSEYNVGSTVTYLSAEEEILLKILCFNGGK